MKWGEVNHTHNGQRATVSDPYPDLWKTPRRITGTINCPDKEHAPILIEHASAVYALPLWYEVEIEDGN